MDTCDYYPKKIKLHNLCFHSLSPCFRKGTRGQKDILPLFWSFQNWAISGVAKWPSDHYLSQPRLHNLHFHFLSSLFWKGDKPSARLSWKQISLIHLRVREWRFCFLTNVDDFNPFLSMGAGSDHALCVLFCFDLRSRFHYCFAHFLEKMPNSYQRARAKKNTLLRNAKWYFPQVSASHLSSPLLPATTKKIEPPIKGAQTV